MPYLKAEKRKNLDANTVIAVDSGELNYVIHDSVDKFLTEEGVNYATLNTVVGVLECVKLELYRRLVSLYEDAKCLQNGDVATYKHHA